MSDFRNAGTEDIYNGNNTKAARRILPIALHDIARRKMTVIRRASGVDQLYEPPSNHLEALEGDRVGEYSVRINRKYRVCFTWNEDAAKNLEITDYH
jgi:proteic killer suppression protein